ncbi:pimeloyl-ACP methyl ester carboxylesterase [Rhodococcus sp. 27YEA15]|uniref:alpha/beta hydrolase n=1 Tax=Rhodococcus sp. 27YEA15 TaxID=3156259 RepID=UPI003C7C4005
MPDITPPTVFSPPPPASTRGAVRILLGRGETAAVYDRFARRLASDGYLVVIADSTETVLSQIENISPATLVGIDSGALDAVHLLNSDPDTADALILVGLPGSNDPAVGDWSEEIVARAGCPTQQRRLREDAIVTPDSLVRESIPAFERLTVDVPVLALHGIDDVISPFDLAEPRYRALGDIRLHTVADGRHDVLNSIHHRTVAAAVVTFLEEVRIDRTGRTAVLDRRQSTSSAIDTTGEK